MTSLDDAIPARLPHLSRTQPWILKLVNQRLDRVHPLVERRRVENRSGEREPLNALGRPLGPDFRARNAPDFFGVGLEEDLVQAAFRSGS